MIARMWRGWTRAEDAGEYARHLQQRVREQASMPGKRGSIILRRRLGDRAEIVTISFWDSLDAERTLAGEHVDHAVFFPVDDQFLIDRETTVSHFDAVGLIPGNDVRIE